MLVTTMLESTDFALLASDVQIKRTVQALEANNIHTIVAENGVDAKNKLYEMIPANAEVFTASSATLDTLGITDEINKSGRYNSVRGKFGLVLGDNREMEKLGATPAYMIGSVQAVTETGSVIMASMTGSQLAGYVSGAEKVIWVVGAQKIVRTLEDGLQRIEAHSLPLEDERFIREYEVHSAINKLLIIYKEYMPGRVTMILVKEDLGF